MQQGYQGLLIYLFAERTQVASKYHAEMLVASELVRPPKCKLDRVIELWQTVLPHRQLTISDNELHAGHKGSSETFQARQLSDGERAIFYLIGVTLSAPENSVLIIDEPELHLHKAIQSALWDVIQASRGDCLFVYITHDLEFAASRTGATRIWLHEYAGGDNWIWDSVPSDVDFPRQLMLEILGSRKPVLLVEGDRSGYDERLYKILYPEHHVRANAGCESVIHAVATCRNLKSQARIFVDVFGLIDRDGRSVTEIEGLMQKGCFALDWVEVENLLLHPLVLHHLSSALDHPPAIVEEIKDLVFADVRVHQERLCTALAGRDLDRIMRGWAWRHADASTLKTSLSEHCQKLDAETMLVSRHEQIEKVISGRDFEAVLKLYDNKGLLAKAALKLGLKGRREYCELVFRRLASPAGESLLTELRKLVPTIPAQA